MTTVGTEPPAGHSSALGAVLRGLPMQLCVWDADLRLAYANAAALSNDFVELRPGRPAAELLGEPASEYLAKFFRAAFEGQGAQIQHTVRTPDGAPDLTHIIDIAPVLLDAAVPAVRSVATQISHTGGSQVVERLRAERRRVGAVLHSSIQPRLRGVLRDLALMPRAAGRRDDARLAGVGAALDDAVVELRSAIRELRVPGRTPVTATDDGGWAPGEANPLRTPAGRQAIFESLPPFGAWGPGGKNVLLNAAARELISCPPDADISGRTLRSLYGPEAEYYEHAVRAALGGAESSTRIEYVDADGASRLGLWRCGPVPHEGTALAVGAMLHIDPPLAEADPESLAAVELTTDRQRIAEDLHDHVIQLLYAAGLAVEAEISSSGSADADGLTNAVGCVTEALVVLDSVLDALSQHQLIDIEGEVRRIVRRTTAPSRLVSRVDILGEVGSIGPDVAVDLGAVLREALSNAARHAHARRVHVVLSAGAEHVRLLVSDDGVGIGHPQRSSGLANMRARAERHGGSFDVRPNDPSGTVVQWTVPG